MENMGKKKERKRIEKKRLHHRHLLDNHLVVQTTLQAHRLVLGRSKNRVKMVEKLGDTTSGSKEKENQMKERKETGKHVEVEDKGHRVVNGAGRVLDDGSKAQDKGAGNNLLHNLLKLIRNLHTV